MKFKIDQSLPLETAGLRPILIWVPDLYAPGFAEACRRQSASLAHDDAETDAAAFIEAAGNQMAR